MYYVWKLLTNILAWLQSPYKLKVFNLAFFSTICWSETRLQDLFHKLWNCSTKGGTVPQKVELFHKKWNCSKKVEQFHFVLVFLDTAMSRIMNFDTFTF